MDYPQPTKVRGFIKEIKETEEFKSGFRKRELVLNTDEAYPQILPLEVTKDKCETLNAFNIGDKIDVFINIKGREWHNPKTDKVLIFVTLQAWKIELLETAERLKQKEEPTDDQPADELPF